MGTGLIIVNLLCIKGTFLDKGDLQIAMRVTTLVAGTIINGYAEGVIEIPHNKCNGYVEHDFACK